MSWFRRLPLWPRSLAARTAFVLIIGLVVVQTLGLGIHTLDRNDLVRLAALRVFTFRVMSIYRDLAETPMDQRAARIGHIPIPKSFSVQVSPKINPVFSNLMPTPAPVRHSILLNMDDFPLPPELRPQHLRFAVDPETRREYTGLEMPDGTWLVISSRLPGPGAIQGTEFLIAFVLMTVLAAALTLWAVRRLTAPVRTLAAAAECLGGGFGLQHHGCPHPALRGGPHIAADRHRT
jgi:hypothetical protein